jgi:hypothetical protein
MDRSKKMLLGGVAAVVVVVVIVVVAWPRGPTQCVPTTTEPDLKALAVQNVASSNPAFLANLVGYIKFMDEKTPTYLPVEATSVTVGQPGKDGFSTVTLTSECATVNFNYKKVATKEAPPVYQFNHIEMFVLNANTNKDNQPKKVCEFDKQFDFSYPESNYYSCQSVRSQSCSDAGKKVAELQLKSFEFEIEGDAEKAKKGEFSKTKWDKSCDQF